jgi:hypothetical protein
MNYSLFKLWPFWGHVFLGPLVAQNPAPPLSNLAGLLSCLANSTWRWVSVTSQMLCLQGKKLCTYWLDCHCTWSGHCGKEESLFLPWIKPQFLNYNNFFVTVIIDIWVEHRRRTFIFISLFSLIVFIIFCDYFHIFCLEQFYNTSASNWKFQN